MQKIPPPSGLLTGIVSLLLFGTVVFAAVGLYAYRNGNSLFAFGNTNQQQPPPRATSPPYAPPAATPFEPVYQPLPTLPPSYSNANSATGGNVLVNANLRMNSNSIMRNANVSEIDNNPKFNGSVIKDRAYLWTTWQDTDDYLEELNTGDRIIIISRSSENRTMFYVETASGSKGWMKGNDIKYTDR